MRIPSFIAATGLALAPWLSVAAQSAGAAQLAVAKPQAAVSFPALAAVCAPSINIHTLASVVRHESQLNPYAININGGSQLERQPTNKAEAIATAQRLLDRGDNIDVGLGQINSANFGWLGLSLSDLFTPCQNITAAARVLSACYQRGVTDVGRPGQAALHEALSCYNTGTLTNGFTNGYVRAVMAQATLPVPELLPLATGEKLAAPVPVRAGRATGLTATPKGTGAPAVGARLARAGGGDVFKTNADPDAFAPQTEDRSTTSNQN